MVWGRFAVPNISALPHCLESQFYDNTSSSGSDKSGSGSIFSCYGGWESRNNHNTIKSMHHTLR